MPDLDQLRHPENLRRAWRCESMASHPLIKLTGKPTKRISYKFLPTAKRLLRESIVELKASGLL